MGNRNSGDVALAQKARFAMVVKTDICGFSGLRIYPGHGITYVRADQKSFKFVSRKSKSLFIQRMNPRKIAWTQLYRRMHKKGTMEEAARKKTKRVNKTTTKAVVGASLEVIRAKRNQKPEVRAAAREAALREVKEKIRQSKLLKRPRSRNRRRPKPRCRKVASSPRRKTRAELRGATSRLCC